METVKLNCPGRSIVIYKELAEFFDLVAGEEISNEFADTLIRENIKMRNRMSDLRNFQNEGEGE